MKAKRTVADTDLLNAGRALARAAVRTKQLAEHTGTPLYVCKDERVVNLNAQDTGSYVLREEPPRR